MAPGKSNQKLRKAAEEEQRRRVALPSTAAATAEQTPAGPVLHIRPPSIEDTLPTSSAGISASTRATSPAANPSNTSPARSIRCKKMKEPELVDMETGEKPRVHKRGVILGTKTQYLIRVNGGQKIKPQYAKQHDGPTSKLHQSLMSRDIGSIIRNHVPMLAPNYLELSAEHRSIVDNHLELSYDIPKTDADMWIYVDNTAERIYKNWKCDCHHHYLHESKETPEEFLHRQEEWEWLKVHFEDPAFKAASIRNSANRNKGKEKGIHHHSGPVPISYRMEELEKSGHLAPGLGAFVGAFEKCKNAEPIVGRVKRKMEEALSIRSQPFADGSSSVTQPLPLETQIEILTKELGERSETKIRGLGGAIIRSLKVRGGARVSKKMDSEYAILRVENEELKRRMSQVEAALAAFQGGQGSGAVVSTAAQSSCASNGD